MERYRLKIKTWRVSSFIDQDDSVVVLTPDTTFKPSYPIKTSRDFIDFTFGNPITKEDIPNLDRVDFDNHFFFKVSERTIGSNTTIILESVSGHFFTVNKQAVERVLRKQR
jgi:hypothetical protein